MLTESKQRGVGQLWVMMDIRLLMTREREITDPHALMLHFAVFSFGCLFRTKTHLWLLLSGVVSLGPSPIAFVDLDMA